MTAPPFGIADFLLGLAYGDRDALPHRAPALGQDRFADVGL